MRTMTIRSDMPYFHGTQLSEAITAMLSGDPLQPRRPTGKSTFSRSMNGFVYLSPSFGQAAEYARMRSRSDWPNLSAEEFSDIPYVFEFNLGGCSCVPDEDELGYAAFVAFCRKSGRDAHWSMNSEFAQAIREKPGFLDRLSQAAEKILENSPHAPLISNPRMWKSGQKTAIGKFLRDRISEDLNSEIIDLGISVAIRENVVAQAYYPMPQTIMSITEADRHEIKARKPDEAAFSLRI